MSFSLTRKTDYALVALAALGREKNGNGQPLSARWIAEAYDLPLPILMNALKELHRAEIVCSRRGAGGGYYLCREPAQITMREVIEAIEGPVNVTLCSDDPREHHAGADVSGCQLAHQCPISDPMQRFNNLLQGFLARMTLESLTACRPNMTIPPTGVSV